MCFFFAQLLRLCILCAPEMRRWRWKAEEKKKMKNNRKVKKRSKRYVGRKCCRCRNASCIIPLLFVHSRAVSSTKRRRMLGKMSLVESAGVFVSIHRFTSLFFFLVFFSFAARPTSTVDSGDSWCHLAFNRMAQTHFTRQSTRKGAQTKWQLIFRRKYSLWSLLRRKYSFQRMIPAMDLVALVALFTN